ncbi:hypothetical protein B0H15DRAFT_1027647 [Mycena belliarum]|uniref:Uncharacterized protein n=1 Tax=Mycena belliarum TaxID=1033014 RepID=A0AAD6TMA3_9AGAR|nr:hypothetical protein B0H15DRAFT_1027647 [Mycena belliae]
MRTSARFGELRRAVASAVALLPPHAHLGTFPLAPALQQDVIRASRILALDASAGRLDGRIHIPCRSRASAGRTEGKSADETLYDYHGCVSAGGGGLRLYSWSGGLAQTGSRSDVHSAAASRAGLRERASVQWLTFRTFRRGPTREGCDWWELGTFGVGVDAL